MSVLGIVFNADNSDVSCRQVDSGCYATTHKDSTLVAPPLEPLHVYKGIEHRWCFLQPGSGLCPHWCARPSHSNNSEFM
jgi:hypothetical protein